MTTHILSQSEGGRKFLEGEEADFLREAVGMLVHEIMEAEWTARVGAKPYERTSDRTDSRNGYRARPWETRVGAVPLSIPRLREGNYLPSFLEPRRRAEKALVSVVQEAYISGVSTRKVDDLVRALGGTGIDKSAVSRICKDLDEQAEAFRTRTLEGQYPFIWLDALYEKVREGGHVRSMAVALAIGVTAEGHREVLGIEVGNAESEAFWKGFLRSLVQRGLSGVQWAVSDAHVGLRNAIVQVFPGASWQRCRVHLMRNIATHTPKSQQPVVLAAVKTIFAQPIQAPAAVGGRTGNPEDLPEITHWMRRQRARRAHPARNHA